MTIKELFTTYWSQFTLLLLTFGYLIKYVFDFISKKKEINFSIYQNRKLESINKFFLNYARVENMWLDLSVYPILKGELNAYKIDEIIFGPINELRSSTFEIKLFSNDDESKNFVLLYESMMSINQKLRELYNKTTFTGVKPLKVSDEVYEFNTFRDSIFKKNEELLNEIYILFKKSYK